PSARTDALQVGGRHSLPYRSPRRDRFAGDHIAPPQRPDGPVGSGDGQRLRTPFGEHTEGVAHRRPPARPRLAADPPADPPPTPDQISRQRHDSPNSWTGFFVAASGVDTRSVSRTPLLVCGRLDRGGPR